MSGMIRGSGQQAKAVWIVLVSYWVVGVPVALLLGFKAGLGVSVVCSFHCSPCAKWVTTSTIGQAVGWRALILYVSTCCSMDNCLLHVAV